MIKYEEAYELGFRIEFDDNNGTYRLSYDGEQTWIENRQIYNKKGIVTHHKIGHFYVKHILKPQLQKGEQLCNMCLNAGKVGIVRYAGRIYGTEEVTVVRYEEDYEYTKDESFGVAYDQWKCTSCGFLADSEYA
ncbi:hypothetical protein [Funiculus sociatus]|uniref:hypothetical protein n=1 Tax=Funiculus sociatus TaxID=450527 RepID=UPI0032971EBF